MSRRFLRTWYVVNRNNILLYVRRVICELFQSNLNQVTVFCPEVQQPIGRIVRRENTNGADMICLATNKSFTMTVTQSHMPASMRVTQYEKF